MFKGEPELTKLFRYKFSRMLDELGVAQPRWKELTSLESAKEWCETVVG
jgi:hypothetical protein